MNVLDYRCPNREGGECISVEDEGRQKILGSNATRMCSLVKREHDDPTFCYAEEYKEELDNAT